MNANIIITHCCNLRCKHCYMSNSLGADDFETLVKNIETLKLLIPTTSVDRINYTGGECTTSPYLYSLLSWSKASSYGVSIFTNGIALKEDIAVLCDNIHLSIDGDNEIHNLIRNSNIAFDGVLNALDISTRHSIPLYVQTSVNKLNVYQLKRILAVYNHLSTSLSSISLECVVNKGNTQTNNLAIEKEDFILVRDFKRDILEYFHYGISVKDNIYTREQIEQFIINSNSVFPFWIDLIEGICYVHSPEFSFPIKELCDESIEKQQVLVKKYLVEKIRHLKVDDLVILDDF